MSEVGADPDQLTLFDGRATNGCFCWKPSFALLEARSKKTL
jgi:hypothetical protein